MATVLLVIQLILSVILTVLVLLQRSEGGALGIGGGGGGFMSGRSATTSIVRLTTIVGGLFILNCIALTIAFNADRDISIIEQESAVEELTTPATPVEDTVPSVDDILLPGGESAEPEEPAETEEPRPE